MGGRTPGRAGREGRFIIAVQDQVIGEIGPGLVILIGITHGDDESDAQFLAQKIATLRIFEDATGKFNRSLLDVGGSALVVSQFTLYADTRRGRRPARAEHDRRGVAMGAAVARAQAAG